MLDKRDYARGELLEKLVEKGEPREEAEAIVDRLTELGFLDDARYAGLVARHYAAKGCGRRRIEAELFRRRVPRELWDAALEVLPPSDSTLDSLLQNRLRGASPDDRAAVRRASDALLRRGFSWEEIRDALERCRQNYMDEQGE